MFLFIVDMLEELEKDLVARGYTFFAADFILTQFKQALALVESLSKFAGVEFKIVKSE